MIVCLCKGISDTEIRKAISDGHHTARAVMNHCGAGTGKSACGGCHESIRQLVRECRPQHHARSHRHR